MGKTLSLFFFLTILTFHFVSCIQPQKTPLHLVAGNGEAGFVDGYEAQLYKPIRLTPFTDSSVLVADIYNHAIREVTLGGRVTTLVGGPDKKGYQDGLSTEAKIESPHGVAYDAQNHAIYFAEASNHVIRVMTKNESDVFEVSTLAGTPGVDGYRDGPTDSAQFSSPHAILICRDGSIAVADIGNARIRRIKDDVVSTLAGNGESGSLDGMGTTATFHYVMDIALHNESIYAVDAGSHLVRKIDPDQHVTTMLLKDTLNTPHGITLDANGDMYIADMGTHRILRIDASKEVNIIAGTGQKGSRLYELNKPAAVLIHNNLLWIADLDNHQIKTITL